MSQKYHTSRKVSKGGGVFPLYDMESIDGPPQFFCILIGVCMCAKSLQSCLTLWDPMRCMQPARLLCPWGFSKQEYWSGLLFPSLGDLLDSGIEPGSLYVFRNGRWVLYHQRHLNSTGHSLQSKHKSTDIGARLPGFSLSLLRLTF